MVAGSEPASYEHLPGRTSVHLVARSDQLPLRVRPAAPVGDDELFELCRANPEVRVERTAYGELVIMSPTGARTGKRNALLNAQLVLWAEREGTGVVFDSSTGFVLPNGAQRSPDASWVRRSRWDALTAEQQDKFAPLCPDFVAELRSPSDDLKELLEKMEEYRDNGAALGWLIDPVENRVYVFRPGTGIDILEKPERLAADPELAGFSLDLSGIW